jgi:Transglutaminase-like superfamily
MYYLNQHAHCCTFNDGAVILDMRSGKYLGIDSRHLPALTANVVDWPTTSTPRPEHKLHNEDESNQLISTLCRRNILTTMPSFKPAVRLPSPLHSVSATGCGRIPKSVPKRHKLLFVVALLRVLSMRHKHHLEPIVDWIRVHQDAMTRRQTPDIEHITRLLWSFERTRVWFYTARQYCLLDSLVLSVFLSLARQPCALVIAVATKPFLAHAWVQVDEAVLNDAVEHVQLFRPLLIVG